MKIFGTTLQVAALCALFDASSALPAGHEICSNERPEHKNCEFDGVFIADRQDGESGLMVYKSGHKHRRQDVTYATSQLKLMSSDSINPSIQSLTDSSTLSSAAYSDLSSPAVLSTGIHGTSPFRIPHLIC
jgi:hypothetical protein